MALPSTIRVKVSSEAAEVISISPVVAQDLRPEELVALVVAGTGKDAARVREVLQRGSFVSGASRFRWDRLEVSHEDVMRLVAPFPEPDPQRPFDPDSCTHVIVRGATTQITIDKNTARRRRLFRRRSLWDEIVGFSQDIAYAGYSYKEQADVYRVTLDRERREQLRQTAQLSPYSSLSKQIETAALDFIEFFVKR